MGGDIFPSLEESVNKRQRVRTMSTNAYRPHVPSTLEVAPTRTGADQGMELFLEVRA
jgi:hypothetical protein